MLPDPGMRQEREAGNEVKEERPRMKRGRENGKKR